MKKSLRQDLTQYSDSELSLIVFNTEYLYLKRKRPIGLIKYLKNNYNFTEAQLAELKQDLIDDSEAE